MKFGIKLLNVFAKVWINIFTLLMLITFVYVWLESGFSAAQEMFSPFNIFNWIATLIALLPAIGAIALAEKLSD